jgi:SAM-dependent methyltransferase
MSSTVVAAAVKSACASSNAAGVRFETAVDYNTALGDTFLNTVSHIESLGPQRLRILEIGAFTGVVSLALKQLGHEVTASDMPFVIEDPGIRDLFARAGIPTLQADLSRPPFPVEAGSFDLIVFNEVLEHLNFNPIPLLRDFNRVLCNHGRIYCATPNLLAAKNRWLLASGRSYRDSVERLVWNLKPGTGMSVGLHWREWCKEELKELFDAASFEMEHHHFGLYASNRSGLFRKHLVALMYRLSPSLMPNQVAIFRKR